MAPNFAAIAAEEQSTQDATLAVSGLVIALAVISVVLRFYTRRLTRLGLGADDWLILVAVVATLITAALLLYGNSFDPLGLWVSENTDSDYVYTPEDILYLKVSFVSSVLYFTIAGATKLGILLMYYRIFSVSTAFRYQLFVAVSLVIGWWVGCTVATLTNCIPLEWSWNNSLADPRYCFDYNVFWMASGACEIFLDVLILTLPISTVVRMRLSTQRKITISIIFLLGGFTIITGLVKVILGYPPDSRVPSYSNTEVWTTVHAGLAIVCASLPIFRPLVRRISELSLVSKASNMFSIRRSSRPPTPVDLETISELSSYQNATTRDQYPRPSQEDEHRVFLTLPEIEAMQNRSSFYPPTWLDPPTKADLPSTNK
ncbi:hypothetical protein F4811DRAFT_195202 [Daldinia bambusicola]|nr:hypothetical protein F4811DRAFT_195202 [Daldinia bambusicola]